MALALPPHTIRLPWTATVALDADAPGATFWRPQLCPESGNKFQSVSGFATGRRGLMLLDRAGLAARFVGQRHRFEILNPGIVAVTGANA
jgi:hypothetical protein